jgi:hypothetical protein
MSGQNKQLFTLLCGSAMVLALIGWLLVDYVHARRFVRFGVEEQATILQLTHADGGRSSTYQYLLQIDQTTMLKKFPYHWTLPIQRSFLVMADPPGPDDIALGNRESSALTVLCYMEGCDKPGGLALGLLALVTAVVVLPLYWVRHFKNRVVS